MAGILLLPLWVCAQGVNFRTLSYAEAIKLAVKEKKNDFHWFLYDMVRTL